MNYKVCGEVFNAFDTHQGHANCKIHLFTFYLISDMVFLVEFGMLSLSPGLSSNGADPGQIVQPVL